jgi:hypothetical protein
MTINYFKTKWRTLERARRGDVHEYPETMPPYALSGGRLKSIGVKEHTKSFGKEMANNA